MNGIGEIMLKCIESFPEDRNEYVKNKIVYKQKLQEPMRKLCEKLKQKRLLGAFLDKSIFNSGEVDFLVVKDKEVFHIFLNKDVINVLTNNFEVENSKARSEGQLDAQKVVFKINGRTIGEIEMRNESEIHYREIKFWLSKPMTLELLKTNIKNAQNFSDRIVVYGSNINKLLKIYKNKK